MNGVERVSRVIKGEAVDRLPLYAWVRENLSDLIAADWGSVEAFEDRYEFDLAHLFGGPRPYKETHIKEAQGSLGRSLEPVDLLELSMTDPYDSAPYDAVRQALDHHQIRRGRFCYMQTPGIFEIHNDYFGIENQLAYLLLFPEEMKQVYRRQAEWNRRFAEVCLDLGVNMIHISDDWGAQQSTLFSPDTWKELVAPNIKVTTEYVKRRGGYVSLHSDGNINSLLPGIRELGFDVIHPFQESAGMEYAVYLREYRDAFAIMGGMDVQTTVGFGNIDFARSEIDRVARTLRERGFILCTTHFIQDHCSGEELAAVLEFAYETVRRSAP